MSVQVNVETVLISDELSITRLDVEDAADSAGCPLRGYVEDI